MRRALPPLLALLTGLMAWPSSAAACAVCFGADKNSKVAQAITIGIILMLAAVFSCLGALVTAVVRMEKNRALAEAAASRGGGAL